LSQNGSAVLYVCPLVQTFSCCWSICVQVIALPFFFLWFFKIPRWCMVEQTLDSTMEQILV
jgi:hypothetical protein